MANIYLLRHGKVLGEPALYGHTDVAVDGEVNVKIISGIESQQLNIDQIYTSPLIRCSSLATRLGAFYQCEIKVAEQFKEMNFGCFDGVAYDELHQNRAQWQQLESFWLNPAQTNLPDAEHLADFYLRIKSAWKSLSLTIEQQHLNENILIVCHGGVIRMILAQLLNVDYQNAHWFTHLSIGYGSLTCVQLTQHNIQVKSIAQPISHLVSQQ